MTRRGVAEGRTLSVLLATVLLVQLLVVSRISLSLRRSALLLYSLSLSLSLSAFSGILLVKHNACAVTDIVALVEIDPIAAHGVLPAVRQMKSPAVVMRGVVSSYERGREPPGIDAVRLPCELVVGDRQLASGGGRDTSATIP